MYADIVFLNDNISKYMHLKRFIKVFLFGTNNGAIILKSSGNELYCIEFQDSMQI